MCINCIQKHIYKGEISMEEPKITVDTSMSKKDYEKFLFIATFRKNKFTIPILILMALIGGLFIGYDGDYFSILRFFISWILMFVFTILVLVFKIKRKNAQRVKTDKTGAFDSINTLRFYEDRIVMENKSIRSRAELKYDQFHALMESKEYFIFYFTANQASLIKKQDIKNLDEFKKFIYEKFRGNYKSI